MLISSWQADEPISERRGLILQLQQGRGRRKETNRWRDVETVLLMFVFSHMMKKTMKMMEPSVMFLISHSLTGVKSALCFFFPMRT